MYRVLTKVPSPPFFFEETFEFASEDEANDFAFNAVRMGVEIISFTKVVPSTSKYALSVCKALMTLDED